jgi:hypothetical protein
MNDLTASPSILSFTVIAAIVTTVGTLFGHFLKEVALARSFENWRSRRNLDAVHRRYRDPLLLSAIELANRLDEVCRDYPTDYLDSHLLDGPPETPSTNARRDAYFARYKCQSTIYRLAAFLGWLELYRQELVFLDVGGKDRTDAWEDSLQAVHSILADGQLLKGIAGWEQWRDALVFREEQRAIGEVMILQVGTSRVVRGYGDFVALLEGESSQTRWLNVVRNFLTDPQPQRDFRRRRYALLLSELVGLVRVLDRNRLSDRLRSARERVQMQPAA